MNEVIKQLYERRSVRSFTEQTIDEQIVQEILTAATMAPTAGNQQLYTIIRVSDQFKLDRLAVSCDNQAFISKGKLVLVFCADCIKWYEEYNSWIKAFCERKFNSDFSREMSRSVEQYMKQYMDGIRDDSNCK